MLLFNIVIIIFFILFQFRNKGVASILYHQVNNKSKVSPEIFESHLEYLKRKKYKTLTIDDYVTGNFNKKEKNIMLTFDDGYFDNYKYVYPLLKKYNMKATIFLNTFYIKNEKRIEDTEITTNDEANYIALYDYVVNKSDGSTWQYMTWEEIKEMSESGLVDFQGHSHKHMPVFSDIKLKDIYKESTCDASDIYLYGGKPEEGYPVFSKRGECSMAGYRIIPEYFPLFMDKYLNSEDKSLEHMQNFVDSNIGVYIFEEDEKEAFDRIYQEGKLNKDIIEEKLKKEVHTFCWPWGHRSNYAISVLEKAGYANFVTTVKGTNSIWGNSKKIRRVELRNFTLKKFILNVEINRNLILGRLYELVS